MKSVHLLLLVAVLASGALIASCASVEPPSEEEGLTADPCTGPSVSFAESEPNNGSTEADHNVVETEEGNLTITGSSASCGNDGTNWTGDMDVFEVSYGCGGLAEVALTWTSANDSDGDDDDSAGSTGAVADLDYNILAPQLSTTHYAAVGYSWDNNAENSSVVELGRPLRVSVMCWSGEAAQEWTFMITWDESSAAGDDDDSSSE